MRDKGYPFPLYSLDLVLHQATPLDDLRFSLPAPGGRLQVRRWLRRRGEHVSTADCQEAALRALALQRGEPALRRCGFDEAWAEALRHWLRRLEAPTEERWRQEVEAREAQAQGSAAQAELAALWRRLALAARMARSGGLLPADPRGSEARRRALREAGQRLGGDGALQALLAEHGFGAPQRRRLAAVLAALEESAARGEQAGAARRACAEELAVLRGALLGDVAWLRGALASAQGRGAEDAGTSASARAWRTGDAGATVGALR